MRFVFVIYHRRELFQVKRLTWLLDRTLLVDDTKDTPSTESPFNMPDFRDITALIGEEQDLSRSSWPFRLAHLRPEIQWKIGRIFFRPEKWQNYYMDAR
jgi:hypothetical protein